MIIHLFTTDELEAKGIRWLVESHVTGVKLVPFDRVENMLEAFAKEQPELYIIDMDKWEPDDDSFGSWLQSVRWLGISSERIFQTAYRGLRFRAQDVLFRPIAPDELMKCIQRQRFQIRNDKRKATINPGETPEKLVIDYSDIFLGGPKIRKPHSMTALLTQDPNKLPVVYTKLQEFPFPKSKLIFAFSQLVLCVDEVPAENRYQEEYYAFFDQWKEEQDEPLAMIMNTHWQGLSIKEMYERTKQLTEMIFFEGYDIILAKAEQIHWSSMDPFLTPLEQRQWIEMLERRDIQAIREWMEHAFLDYKKPYPPPEMVRIRITSVLAQIRRYMKSQQLQHPNWERDYHDVFRQIIQEPVVYRIVQDLLSFTIRLLTEQDGRIDADFKTLVDRVKSLMESNYWNPQWNLEDCANTLQIHKSTLSRRFAAESGKTFRETLHEIKMGEAKRLLKETNLSLDEIARLVGYQYRTYFNAKFKQMEKKTPTEYRMGLGHLS